MRIYLISNTKFGYRNNDPWYLDYMVKYFYDEFIPYLSSKIKPEDFIVHLGSVFDKTTNLNMLTIDKVQHIFIRLLELTPNVILLLNKSDAVGKQEATIASLFNKIKICKPPHSDNSFSQDGIKFYSNKISLDKSIKSIVEDIIICSSTNVEDFNKTIITGGSSEFKYSKGLIRVGAPYQLDSIESDKKGFLIYNTEKKSATFIKNEKSPKFLKLRLESEESIDNLLRDGGSLNNNKVDITINSELICKKKIEYLLNKYPFNRVSWSTMVEEEIIDDIVIGTEELDVDKLLLKYLEDNNLNDIHNEVLKVYKDSYKD